MLPQIPASHRVLLAEPRHCLSYLARGEVILRAWLLCNGMHHLPRFVSESTTTYTTVSIAPHTHRSSSLKFLCSGVICPPRVVIWGFVQLSGCGWSVGQHQIYFKCLPYCELFQSSCHSSWILFWSTLPHVDTLHRSRVVPQYNAWQSRPPQAG